MLLMSLRARLLLCLIAIVLLVPVAGIGLQDELRLMYFHKRRLHALPDPAQFMRDPVYFFHNAKSWLADRAYPITQAAVLQRQIQFYVLRTPPQRHITLGSDGFVFINGDGDAATNSFFTSACVNAHSDAVAAKLHDDLATIAAFARTRSMAVDVVVVPTSITLYADHLPASVPKYLRDACHERSLGHSPLARTVAPPGVSFVFPFEAMKAASNDDAFFPKGNWHAKGMSLKVVRDTYLAALGITTPVNEQLERGEATSEILSPYGIDIRLPAYDIRNSQVSFDTERDAAFNAAIRARFQGEQAKTRAYRNANPVIDESVFMLSDSYGEMSSEVFAGAFRHVVQVTSNNLPPEHVVDVIDRTRATFAIDRLILLVQEGNVGGLLVWSDALRSATPVTP